LQEPEIAAALAPGAKIVIGGEEFVDDIWSLVASLKRTMRERGRTWRLVVGVLRGGVFPAQRVAEALGIGYGEIHISYYRGLVRQSAPRVLTPFAGEASGGDVLIVDDVIDSGGTALCVRGMLPGCDLAAVYTKPAGLQTLVAAGGEPPFCGRPMDDRWIVFPWDQPGWDEQSPKLINRFRERIGAPGRR
jgi:xanthine phosphoribosyltransferase